MAIQWFPGHMHATRKALAERLPEIDVVVELLDARLPGSSSNPLLAELTGTKPALKLLNKADLADPDSTTLWLAHLQAQPGTQAQALDAHAGAKGGQGAALQRQLVAACRALAPLRGGMVKPLRVLICGIPNVGKSTLINSLVGQRSAKTGDEPGITKTEQKIVLANDAYLIDTPGVLWPRITVPQSGEHLAASGGIGRNAYDEVEVALALLARVRPRYGERLLLRYKLAAVAGMADAADETWLNEIGRRRGGLMPGGVVNQHKAAEIVLNDFRSGAWGRITLETPAEFAAWVAEGEAAERARQAKVAARRAKKKPQREADAEAAAEAAADAAAAVALLGQAPEHAPDATPDDMPVDRPAGAPDDAPAEPQTPALQRPPTGQAP